MKLVNTLEKYPQVTIGLVTLLMLFVHLDIPNVTIMEARNFITAREMIEDGNWFLTTMNGEPRYQKPPLPTWLTATSALLFGADSVYFYRLPAALMVLLLAWGVYLLGEAARLLQLQSFRTSLILVTSFYVIGIINEAPWDIFTHGFMLFGLYYLFKLLQHDKFSLRNGLLSALFIGLSVLSKGPVSGYALFLPFIIAYLIVYKDQSIKKVLLPAVVILALGFLAGSGWYIYVRLADSETFMEIATKETTNWGSYNVKPFYYYWSFFVQSGIWAIPALVSLLYPYMIKRVNNVKAYKLFFWWTLLSVVLLSLIPEKKSRYLMPVLIPLAFTIGFYMDYLIRQFKDISDKRELLPVLFNYTLIILICLGLPLVLVYLSGDIMITNPVSFFGLLFVNLLIGILLIRGLAKREMKSIFYLTICFFAVLLLFGIPLSTSLQDKNNFNSISSLHLIEQQESVQSYAIGDLSPELVWDYNGKIPNIFKNEELELPKDSRFGLLIMKRDLNIIKPLLEPAYSLELKTSYDLNVVKRKKERLQRDFYLVSKK